MTRFDYLNPSGMDSETFYLSEIDGLKTKDGAVYTGELYQESLTWNFLVDNDDYDTTEEPPTRFDQEYQLARTIGDVRFGSQCQHERARLGYCLSCQRRVR